MTSAGQRNANGKDEFDATVKNAGIRDVTFRSGAMPRKSIGETAMTDAERQARYRAARAAGSPVIRTRRPADHRSRARLWTDNVNGLVEEQAEYAAWL